MKNKIQFTVIEQNTSYNVETYHAEFRNLMFLLRDKFCLDSFGECGGMGRCATCLIKINNLTGNAVIKDRNEPVTLSKIAYNEENIRLSCQLLVNEDLNGVVVELIEMR